MKVLVDLSPINLREPSSPLSKDSEIKIHRWNLKILIVEVNKKINYYAQTIMSLLFVFPGIARFGTICTI